MNEWLIAALVLSAIGDAVTTMNFLGKPGHREGNPIGRWFHKTFGNLAGTVLAKVLQVILVVGIAQLMITTGTPQYANYVLGVGIAFNIFIILWNLQSAD